MVLYSTTKSIQQLPPKFFFLQQVGEVLMTGLFNAPLISINYIANGRVTMSQRNTLRLRITNEVTQKSKNARQRVEDEGTLWELIQNDPSMAPIRTWPEEIQEALQEEKVDLEIEMKETKTIFSTEEMKMTTMGKIVEIWKQQQQQQSAEDDDDAISLIIRTTTLEKPSLVEEAYNEDNNESSNEEIPKEEESKEVGEPPMQEEPKEENEESSNEEQSKPSLQTQESFKPQGFRQRGWLPNDEGMDTKKSLRVRIINQVTNRFKDLLVNVNSDENMFDAIYDLGSVKTAGVRKWPSNIVQQVKEEAGGIQCLVLMKDGNLLRTLTVDELRETTTVELSDLVASSSNKTSQTNDVSMIQLVLEYKQFISETVSSDKDVRFGVVCNGSQCTIPGFEADDQADNNQETEEEEEEEEEEAYNDEGMVLAALSNKTVSSAGSRDIKSLRESYEKFSRQLKRIIVIAKTYQAALYSRQEARSKVSDLFVPHVFNYRYL